MNLSDQQYLNPAICYNGCGKKIYSQRYHLCRNCYLRETKTGLKTPEQKALEIELAALRNPKPRTKHQELEDCAMQIINLAQQILCRDLVTAALGDGLFWIKNVNDASDKFEERWLRQAMNASKYFQPTVIEAE